MQHVYSESAESKTLKTENLILKEDVTRKTIYLNKPAFEFEVLTDSENVSAQIIEQSSYMAAVEFTKLTEGDLTVDCTLLGKEYLVNDSEHVVQHNEHGSEINWNNPLVSTEVLANDLASWLAEYFLGDVEYNISWRGDPRVDAGDLMYLELKDRETALIKATENSLTFNGSWRSTIKGRKVAVSWQ